MNVLWKDVALRSDETGLRQLIVSNLPEQLELPAESTVIDQFNLVDLKLIESEIQIVTECQIAADSKKAELIGSLRVDMKLEPKLAGDGLSIHLAQFNISIQDLQILAWNDIPVPRILANATLRVLRSQLREKLQIRIDQILSKSALTALLTSLCRDKLPLQVHFGSGHIDFTSLALKTNSLSLGAEVGLIGDELKKADSYLDISWKELNALILANISLLNQRLPLKNWKLSSLKCFGNSKKLGLELEINGSIKADPMVLLDLSLDVLKQELKLITVEVALPTETAWIAKFGLKLVRARLQREIAAFFPIDLGGLISQLEQGKHTFQGFQVFGRNILIKSIDFGDLNLTIWSQGQIQVDRQEIPSKS